MKDDDDRDISIGMRWNEFDELDDRLEAWMEARPFVFRGSCPYARSIILRMIDLCEEIIDLGDKDAEKQRESLLPLLDELPPPTSPLTSGLFYCNTSLLC